jgi:hypothetical protein
MSRTISTISLCVLFIIFRNFNFAQTVIYSNNFNSENDTYPLHAPTTGSSTWKATYISGGTNSRWAIYKPTALSTKALEMYVGGTDLQYSITQACNVVAYENTPINASLYSDVSISFVWKAGGETGNENDYLIPVYSLDDGTTWNDVGTKLTNPAGYASYSSVTDLPLPACDGTTFKIGFRWVNNNSTGDAKGPAIDDIVVKGTLPPCTGTPIQGAAFINRTIGCVGSAIELELSAIGFSVDSSGLSHQWQYSSDGATNWTNLTSGTNPYLHNTTSTTTNYYQLAVTCSNSGVTTITNTLHYTAETCTGYNIGVEASVNTCLAMFYDSGGSGGNYGNNENRTTTFCSTSGENLMVDFFTFNTQTNGLLGVNQIRYDYLNVFDGNSTSSPQMFSFAGIESANDQVPLVISSGSCLTFQFISNGSTVRAGWTALVSCTNQSNNVATNYCETAPNICNLNGYVGTTSSFYNPQNVGGQIIDSGSGTANLLPSSTLDNNSFITFIPSATSVSLSLNVSNCSGGTSALEYFAIQLAIYSQVGSTECDFDQRINDYYHMYDGIVQGNHTINLTGLTIGATYYVMVDGLWGSVCDYTINVNSGVAVPSLDVNFAAVCVGEQVTLTASGASNYVWSGPGIDGETTPSVTVDQDGTFIVTMETGDAACPEEVVEVANIIHTACSVLPIELSSMNIVCNDRNTVELIWETASEINNYYYEIERSKYAIHWESAGIVYSYGNSTNQTKYNFKDNNSIFGQSYYRLIQVDYDGTKTIYGPWTNNCDTDFEINVFPNPNQGTFTISIFSKEILKNSQLIINDITGKIVYEKHIDISVGNNSFMVQEFDLAKGSYFVQLNTSRHDLNPLKIVIQ